MFNTLVSMSTQHDLENQFISELLIARAERLLQEAIDDFGGSFVSSDRPQIEALIHTLRQALAAQDETAITTVQSTLNNVLGNLSQRATQRQKEEDAYWLETYWEGLL
jgi:hypothetical protein